MDFVKARILKILNQNKKNLQIRTFKEINQNKLVQINKMLKIRRYKKLKLKI